MKKQIKTYDVVFNDNNTNSKGMNGTKNKYPLCIFNSITALMRVILMITKGGIVFLVVCNETNETIFETTVK